MREYKICGKELSTDYFCSLPERHGGSCVGTMWAARFWDGQKYRFCPNCQGMAFEFADAYAAHVSRLSSEAIESASKEAATKIEQTYYLNDWAAEVESVEPEIAAIIRAAIEKARSK